ncbi:DUF58 domain-containing protein [Pantoea rwandensis]|uniref:ATPase n=1 Tax=Pantoea rwandensis TaxID=1076550 RepID=A0A1X1D620_9GAMM|nr:DUF58 domain-containing protein [Pantoea rwandensis]ORM72135.1 ATPase [Pantoea rwandensis]
MAHPLTIDMAVLLALAAEAKRLDNPPSQIPPGAMAGERVSRQQGRGLNFDSLRRYQPGDDVRLIDWKTTARLRSPWIRLYNEERERPVFILLDQRLDMYFGTRLQTKSVAAAKITGLLAWRSWHDGDRLGCAVMGDDELVLHPCRAPKRNLMPILTDVERLNGQLPARHAENQVSTLSLAGALQRIIRLLPSGSWLAIISDFHDLDASGEALLAHLRRRCDITAYVTLDDLHQRLPRRGQLAAYYQNVSSTLSLSASLSQNIQQSVTERLSQQQRRLQRVGVTVKTVITGEAVLPQLQQEDTHAGKRF